MRPRNITEAAFARQYSPIPQTRRAFSGRKGAGPRQHGSGANMLARDGMLACGRIAKLPRAIPCVGPWTPRAECWPKVRSRDNPHHRAPGAGGRQLDSLFLNMLSFASCFRKSAKLVAMVGHAGDLPHSGPGSRRCGVSRPDSCHRRCAPLLQYF